MMSPTAAGLLAVAMWCVTTMLWVLISAAPPLEITAIVFFIGYFAMTAVQIVRKENIVAAWNRPLSDYLFWLGTAGFYTILTFICFRVIPIFEANILVNIWPVLLFVFAAVINKTRVAALHMIGGVLGFVGVIALFWPAGDTKFFADFHWGHGLSLFAAAVWAFYSALARRVPYPAGFMGPVFLVFSLICAALHFVFEDTVMPLAPEWIAIIGLGVLRVSYALWDYGMKKGDVILLAAACYFIPLLSSIGLWLAGAGPARPMIGIGAAFIIAGCLLCNYRDITKIVKRLARA